VGNDAHQYSARENKDQVGRRAQPRAGH
jgi:hypothetical protein